MDCSVHPYEAPYTCIFMHIATCSTKACTNVAHTLRTKYAHAQMEHEHTASNQHKCSKEKEPANVKTFHIHSISQMNTAPTSQMKHPQCHPHFHSHKTLSSCSPAIQSSLCQAPRFRMTRHCRAAGKDEVVAPKELVHRGNSWHGNVLLSTEGRFVTVRR